MNQSTPFSTETQIDAETGWEVIYLLYQDEDPDQSIRVGIVPKAGSNMFSLQLGQDELLWQAPSIRAVQKREHGNPVLYPTPNRVRNSRFTFEGRTFTFPPNWKEHFLHGLVHGAQWNFQSPRADEQQASVMTYIDFEPGHELYDLWPFDHRIALTFTLEKDGVTVRFDIQNRDDHALPFGFALHPFFNYLGDKSKTVMCVPATHHMQAVDLLPTGGLEPLDGSKYDLRTPVSLDKLHLDDVYYGMVPEKPAWYEIRDRGIRLTMKASPEFTHVVVFTEIPEFFCIENQTCSTDAHNLYAQGLKKESHLLIVQPGESMSMWVKYVPERI